MTDVPEQKRSTWIAFESPVTGSGLIVNRAWADKFQTDLSPRFLRRSTRNGNWNDGRIRPEWNIITFLRTSFGTAWEIKILHGSCLAVQSFPGIWNLRIVRSAKLTRMKFVVRCIRSRRMQDDDKSGDLSWNCSFIFFWSIIFVSRGKKSLGWFVEILFFLVSLNVSRKCYEIFARYSFLNMNKFSILEKLKC